MGGITCGRVIMGYKEPEICGSETLKPMRKEVERIIKEKENLFKLNELEEFLWETLVKFQKHPFYTAKNLEFQYIIKGNEMFVTRKEKSITKATIVLALRKSIELQREGKKVSGPKKLGVFGASYLWPIFRDFGVFYLDDELLRKQM